MPIVNGLRRHRMNERAWNDDVIELLGAEERAKIKDIVECLKSFPESAFEDGLDWLQCLIACEYDIYLRYCVQ